VQADARSHVYLYSYRNRIDPDTFCRMYVYKHINVFLLPKIGLKAKKHDKKEKIVTKK
jgi:hypothetical protein